MVYRRRELWLLLLFAVSLGAGLAVREFRAGFPDLSDRLEQLDREEPTLPVTPPAAFPSRSPKRSEIQTTREGRGAAGRAGDGTRGAAGRAGDEAGQLDLNRATTEELQRLPGIGPTLAGQIVRARERRGRFASPEDLRTVPGIGQKKFEGIRDLITVSEGRDAEGWEAAGRAGDRAGAGDGAREAEGGAGDHLPPAVPAPPRPQPPEDTEIYLNPSPGD